MMNYGQLFHKKNSDSFRIHVEEPLRVQQLASAVFSFLPASEDRSIVIVCIGSDRSTGDSLGPLIGTKLLERQCPLFSIYGSLSSPVHAKNLEETMITIKTLHDNPYIIAVDACLGRTTSVGYMTVADGPVKPGAAVQKSLQPVGDIHMTGIVNVSGYMEMLVLQNTRLSLVMDMAESMSRAIWRAAFWQKKRATTLAVAPQKEINL
ncbi:spore protease YyaC [Salipaludibacillus neizhouensis]